MFTIVSFRVLLLLLVISDFVEVGFVMINFYSVLGVAKNAAGGDIRKAYLQLCRRWHPDKNHPGKFEKCNAKMEKINRAFHTLSDANLKENYDMEMENAEYDNNERDEECESDESFNTTDDSDVEEIPVITIEDSDEDDNTDHEGTGNDSNELENYVEGEDGKNEEDEDSVSVTMSNDFYSVLGVAKDASADEIKKVYYELCRIWHPDRNGDNQEKATIKMQQICEAYETLGDREKRICYDGGKEDEKNDSQEMDPRAPERARLCHQIEYSACQVHENNQIRDQAAVAKRTGSSSTAHQGVEMDPRPTKKARFCERCGYPVSEVPQYDQPRDQIPVGSEWRQCQEDISPSQEPTQQSGLQGPEARIVGGRTSSSQIYGGWEGLEGPTQGRSNPGTAGSGGNSLHAGERVREVTEGHSQPGISRKDGSE